MRVIIAGTRTLFVSGARIEAELTEMLVEIPDDLEIVSGGAKGADACGEAYALERGVPINQFPADWAKYGAAAGPRRNKKMAEFADACLIFIKDGTPTPGSANMLMWAHIYGLHLKVVEV